MKKIFTILAVVLLTTTVLAQSPEKMSYQAVIRNYNGELVVNQIIGMQISILKSSINGFPVYVETQITTSNENGLISIQIGSGTASIGAFNTIDWSNGPYFIKTEIDITGETNFNYTITGVSQLLSVPYALYAKKAETVTGEIPETDPIFTAWDKSSGISIVENQISDFGNYIETESQNLSNILTLSNDATGSQIKNLANPTDSQDITTKAYIDAFLARIEALEESDQLNHGLIDMRDNNYYNVVKIGLQTWMVENLRYLPSVVGPATDSYTIPYYYVYGYNGTNVTDAKATSNYNTYGVLYNWPAAMAGSPSSSANPSGVQGICPSGWHLPSNEEWIQLTNFLGGTNLAVNKLKESGQTHWINSNNGTNETGFTAIPGGSRYHFGGYFITIGNNGHWWSTNDQGYDQGYVGCMEISYNQGLQIHFSPKEHGFSVRCVKN